MGLKIKKIDKKPGFNYLVETDFPVPITDMTETRFFRIISIIDLNGELETKAFPADPRGEVKIWLAVAGGSRRSVKSTLAELEERYNNILIGEEDKMVPKEGFWS